MPKVLFASDSPYGAKVRMAAALADIVLEPVTVEAGTLPEELTSVNPLGTLPSMVLDNGNAVFDSRAITQCLNRMSHGVLYPRTAARRLEAERLEALADGICDCLLAHVSERRMRPPEKVHQPWLDLQWAKALRSLDKLNAHPPRLGKRAHAGHIALRACLGYLDLRFHGQWERGRYRLRRWAIRFDDRYPGLKQYLPASPGADEHQSPPIQKTARRRVPDEHHESLRM